LLHGRSPAREAAFFVNKTISMKPVLLFLLFTGIAALSSAQALDSSDMRRIGQRRIFATGFYRLPKGSPGYCGGAHELAFIAACEGKKDSAFYFLNEELSYNGNDEKVLKDIYDPFGLGNYPFMKWKKTKEWQAYEQTITKKYMQLAKDLKQPKLAFDLLKAFGLDQSIRLYLMKIHNDTAAKADAKKIGSANLMLIKQLVRQYGFPGLSMVGSEAYEAAFILCQHADDDLAFQKTVLESLKKLATAGDARKEDVAYLTDRVMVKEKGVQLYGTQFKSAGTLYPITDSVNVDKRRAEMGMTTLAEYKKGFMADRPAGKN